MRICLRGCIVRYFPWRGARSGARLGHELADGEDEQHAGHAGVDERDLGLVGRTRAQPIRRCGRTEAEKAPLAHAFGRIGTALSKKIGVFPSSSLNVAPRSPNAALAHAQRAEGESVINKRPSPPNVLKDAYEHSCC